MPINVRASYVFIRASWLCIYIYICICEASVSICVMYISMFFLFHGVNDAISVANPGDLSPEIRFLGIFRLPWGSGDFLGIFGIILFLLTFAIHL